jgi:phenylacetate-CoA ligase
MAKTAKHSTTSIWNPDMELQTDTQLQELQLNRLKALVTYLQERNSFYRQRLSSAGISSSGIRSIEDLGRLPFTSKSDLQDNYPTGLFSRPMNELSRLHASSGSKGRPIMVGYSKKDLSTWAEVCARSLLCAGVTASDIIQNSYGYGLFTGGLGIHYGAELIDATVVPASGGMTRRQISLLQDLHSTVLCSTPTYALNIACTMEELGLSVDDLSLRLGIFGAEPWSEEMRNLLEDKLSIRALDIYGLSEVIGPGVAMECSQSHQSGGGLHIWEDHFLVEIIDPETGNVLPDGAEGELVFTTLTKEALPLLRYRTGDISSLNRKPCQCGRTMVRMSRVKARLDDMLIIRGVNFYPTAVEEILLVRPELSPRYRLIVDREKALDTLCLQVEIHQQTAQSWKDMARTTEVASQKKRIKSEIKKLLKDMLFLAAEVELMPPGSLISAEAKSVRVVDRRITNAGNSATAAE